MNVLDLHLIIFNDIWIGLHLFNNDTYPSGHISRPKFLMTWFNNLLSNTLFLPFPSISKLTQSSQSPCLDHWRILGRPPPRSDPYHLRRGWLPLPGCPMSRPCHRHCVPDCRQQPLLCSSPGRTPHCVDPRELGQHKLTTFLTTRLMNQCITTVTSVH